MWQFITEGFLLIQPQPLIINTNQSVHKRKDRHCSPWRHWSTHLFLSICKLFLDLQERNFSKYAKKSRFRCQGELGQRKKYFLLFSMDLISLQDENDKVWNLLANFLLFSSIDQKQWSYVNVWKIMADLDTANSGFKVLYCMKCNTQWCNLQQINNY